MRARRLALALALTAGMAEAQEPQPNRQRFSFAVGGEASFTMAPVDRGFFNDLDYGHNALRLARLSLTGRLGLGQRSAVLADVRTENMEAPRIHALYLSVRPWERLPFDVQLGRIPPVFGAYPRRGYAPGEPLPGVPLAYQYLTTLRADALPGSADDLLWQRGAGWRVWYPIGDTRWAPGLPLVSAFQWDAGVEVRLGSDGGPVEASAAVTQGSLSHPQLRDDNGGKQVAGRLALRPLAGLVGGLSAARGEYVDEAASNAVAALTGRRQGFHQDALGVDLEYARGHGLVRAEAVWSRWALPEVQTPRLTRPLEAWSAFVEAHRRLAPGLSLAARAERLQFSRIRGSEGEATWDARVSRLEAALAYALRRQIIVKAAYQHNWRAARRPRQGLVIGQLVLWF
jgi:hypothetical protein